MPDWQAFISGQSIQSHDTEPDAGDIVQHVTLDALIHTEHDDIPDLLCNSLSDILQYNMKDIQDTLLKLQKDTLLLVHRKLAAKIVTMFPIYNNKRLKSRMVKNTLVPDIYNMGISLVEQTPTKDLEKMFAEYNTTKTDDWDAGDDSPFDHVEIAQLITTVSNLQIKLVAIEAELIVLRKDKSEREPCHCKCASVTITPTRDMSVTIEAPTPRADLVIMNTEPIVNNNTDVISSSDSECDLANLSQFEIPAKYRKKISKLKKRADHANTPSTIQAVSVSAEVTDNKRPAAKPTHSIAAVITQQTQPVDTKLRAAEHSSNSTKCYIYVGKVHPSSTPDAISAQLIGMGVQCQKGLLHGVPMLVGSPIR
jgi:hypothetical protein